MYHNEAPATAPTTPLPMVNKVRITDGEIFINGERAGYIAGTRSEVWVHGSVEGNPHAFVGRFKYMKPGTKARNFIKAVFSRMTMQEYLAALATARSPRDVAVSIGADY